jgi:uncharacterized protein
MVSRDFAKDSDNGHAAAADAFVSQARSHHLDKIVELVVFGSTARGDTHGLASDVDIFVVLANASDQGTIADDLRDIAYDVMLEYGPVVELHIVSQAEFDQLRAEGNPFVQNVFTEGKMYA